MSVDVSLAALRRYVVAHQGFTSRTRRGTASELADTVGRLQAVQLDSISTVDRAHRLTLASRVGAYRRGVESDEALPRATERDRGRIVETSASQRA